MSTLLVVLNARRIPDALASYEALDVDVGYLIGYPEWFLAQAFSELPEYERYIAISDDCVVTQGALDAVLELLDEGHPVATGYCNLDMGQFKNVMNICKSPLPGPTPTIEAYDFYSRFEVQSYPTSPIPTTFAGMCLTGMSLDMWRRFPFEVSPLGLQTDYSLSFRLQEAGIPIVAARGGEVLHLKELWNTPDQAPEKRILVGQIPPEVRVRERAAI